MRGRVLKPGVMNRFGHLSVSLGKGNSRCVHDLVLSAFVSPRPQDCEARHLNTNGSDNRLDNLAWGSKSQNGKDVTAAGKRMFTYAQAQEIGADRESGMTYAEMSEKWGGSKSHMRYIAKGVYYGV